jgi:serine protease Do
MNSLKRLLQSQIGWALVAGAAVGTAATVGFLYSRSPALAGPSETVLSGASAETLRALDQAGVELVEKVSPSVVLIRTSRSEGSGVVYRTDGYILTNAHVVQGNGTVRVFFHDGREANGKVIADQGDSFNDIAVIKVDRTDLKAARFADSTAVRPGQIAVAFGAPFGLQESVSFGHVSATGRMNAIPDPSASIRARVYTNMIQTDAAINPGNSGGPLLNYKGEVIGINSAINSMTGYNTGVGFAIPSNTAKLIAQELIEDGEISRAFLGLRPEPLKAFEQERMNIAGGAIVRSITPGSPADKAGIKVGDVIVKLGEHDVRSDQDVWNAMVTIEAGKALPVEVIRNGSRKAMTAYPVERTAEIDGQAIQQEQNPGLPDPFEDEDLADRGPAGEGSEARLGVNVRDLRPQEKKFAPAGSGAYVVSVEPNSPAARAGIRSGYVITRVGDAKVGSAEDLAAALAKHGAGDQTTIAFGRADESGQVQMTATIRF